MSRSPVGGGASVAYPPNHIDGLTVNYVNATTVSISAGTARSSANATDGTNAASFNVAITASGSKGLDTGAEGSDTWYAVHAIWGAGGLISGLLSESATSPTLPSGFSYFRLVGWVKNDSSSDFWPFSCYDVGRERWVWNGGESNDASLSVLSAGASTSFADVDCSAAMPPGTRVGSFWVVNAANGSTVRVRPKGNTTTNGTLTLTPNGAAGDCVFDIDTDTSQVFQYKNTTAARSTSLRLFRYRLVL